MIDSRDAAGATDPDPGCSNPADTSENSEVPSPDWCEIQVGIFDNDIRLPGLSVEGCGVIKGVWFKPPGTPVGCVFKVGANDAAECDVKGGTGGATFALDEHAGAAGDADRRRRDVLAGDGRAGARERRRSTPTACRSAERQR